MLDSRQLSTEGVIRDQILTALRTDIPPNSAEDLIVKAFQHKHFDLAVKVMDNLKASHRLDADHVKNFLDKAMSSQIPLQHIEELSEILARYRGQAPDFYLLCVRHWLLFCARYDQKGRIDREGASNVIKLTVDFLGQMVSQGNISMWKVYRSWGYAFWENTPTYLSFMALGDALFEYSLTQRYTVSKPRMFDSYFFKIQFVEPGFTPGLEIAKRVYNQCVEQDPSLAREILCAIKNVRVERKPIVDREEMDRMLRNKPLLPWE
jgi:hypothetical protein